MGKKSTVVAGAPLDAHDRLLKVINRSETIRALRQKLAALKEQVKEIRAQIDEEEIYRDQEIFDEPEGALGFTDGKSASAGDAG